MKKELMRALQFFWEIITFLSILFLAFYLPACSAQDPAARRAEIDAEIRALVRHYYPQQGKDGGQ